MIMSVSGETIIGDKIGGAGARDLATTEANMQRLIDHRAAFAVASGPGGEAGRVTDAALEAIDAFRVDDVATQSARIDEIGDRLATHAKPFGRKALQLAYNAVDEIREGFEDGRGFGWIGMAGERYQAKLDVHWLREAGHNARYMNPTSHLRRDVHGSWDPTSAERLAGSIEPDILTIFPGTPGTDAQGNVIEIPPVRGFTDSAGLLVAAAYRLLTGHPTTYRLVKDDVNGILRASPKLVDRRDTASELSVAEAEILTQGGSEVVQPSVLELLQDVDVDVQVGNGESPGTTIVRSRESTPEELIAGIAVQGAVAYTVSNLKMEHRSGTGSDILGIFTDNKVPFIDVRSGTGVVRVYVNRAASTAKSKKLEGALYGRFGDSASVAGTDKSDRFSIVTLAGEGLRNPAKRAEALKIVADSGLEGKDSWISPNDNALYVTVPDAEVKPYVQEAYDRFFGEDAA